ncbi:MAG: glycosyltransferase, partial [Pyrinomonadaceae bacterium]|nr:glycosyltransferase [Pyrinomonadaceae bacterium]
MSPQLITTTRAYLRQFKLLRTLMHALRTLSRAPRTRLAAYQQRMRDRHRRRAELQQQRSAATRFQYQQVLSLLTAAHNSDFGELRSTIESVRSQTYPKWQLCIVCDGSLPPAVVAALNRYAAKDARIKVTHGTECSGKSAALANHALRSTSGEFVGLLAAGDQLAPEALYAVVMLLNQQPAADMIYTDEDEVGADGMSCRRVLKPDWSPEHFLAGMYTGSMSLYRRALVTEVGGFREEMEGAHEYDLALRIVERSKHIHHVARVLHHRRGGRSAAGAAAQFTASGAAQRAVSEYLHRNRIAAICEAGVNGVQHRVRYRIAGQPLVSIIIPTAGYRRVVGEREVDLLVNCVQSVLGKTQYHNYEILCISDGDLQQETKQAINDARVSIITFSKPFNFAEKINFGARHARGEQFLFLNDDTEVISGEWLTAMLEFSQQQAIGAVGAKLYFPDGAIQHAGVVIPEGGPCHIFYEYPKE